MALSKPVNIMLDSGAFSAWRKGEKISIRDYISFIKKHRDQIEFYISLDIIPGEGKPVSKRTTADCERSAKLSYENLQRMADADLRPIPVFHYGERMYWLERMIDEGWDYMGLASGHYAGIPVKRKWLDQCFRLICSKTGPNIIRTHGFALSVITLIYDYPWYSVDSLTARALAIYGQILVPRILEGTKSEYDYTKQPYFVAVSDGTSFSRRVVHINLFDASSATRRRIERFLSEEGFTVSDVRDSDIARSRLNVRVLARSMEASVCPIDRFLERQRRRLI